MGDQPARYQLGPRSRRGLVAGWRGGQIAVTASGLLLALGLMRLAGGPLGVVAALVTVLSAVAISTWPVAGRTAEQWAPALVGHVTNEAASRRVRASARARSGLSGLSVQECDQADNGRRLGVVSDTAEATHTAVLPVAAVGYALADHEEQSRRVASWASVLAGVAREGGNVHRLQWIVRALPGAGGALVLPDHDARALAAKESYRALVEEVAPLMWSHEVLVAVTVRADRRTRARQPVGRAGLVVEELAALRRRCVSAGLEVRPSLSRRELAAAILRATAPCRLSPAGLDSSEVQGLASPPSGRSAGASFTSSPGSWPWPLGVKASWRSIRTDATFHAVYWVAGWPRGEVGPDFLTPLLLAGGVRLTFSVTMAPIPPLKAARRAEHDRTSGVADAELRRRYGFATTSRSLKDHEATVRREGELADGHAGYRYSGYLAVTESDEASLERSCARVELLAVQSGLEAHRMYGAQEAAFCFVLPTGRGCA